MYTATEIEHKPIYEYDPEEDEEIVIGYDGYEYSIINQTNPDDPDAICWSKEKPDSEQIEITLRRMNYDKDNMFFARNPKSGCNDEITQSIIDCVNDVPKTCREISELTGCPLSRCQKIITKLWDKGTFKGSKNTFKTGGGVMRYTR